jgi:hypothetical protein
MEANPIHTNLLEFLTQISCIDLTPQIYSNKIVLNPGEMVQIHYIDNISKYFAIKKILTSAQDVNILSLVIDTTGRYNASDNCWVYKVFSAVDLVHHVNTLPSLLRDIKKKVVIVVDTFNTYLPHAKHDDFLVNPGKSKLSSMLTYNIFSILNQLREDYNATIFIFWQFIHSNERRYIPYNDMVITCCCDYMPETILKHIWLSTIIIPENQLLQIFYLDSPNPLCYIFNQRGELLDVRTPVTEISET